MTNRSGRLRRGAVANLTNTALFSGGQLLALPVLISKLGISGYETWLTALSILSVTMIIDGGVASRFSAQTRAAFAESRAGDVSQIVGRAISLYAFIIVPSLAAGIVVTAFTIWTAAGFSTTEISLTLLILGSSYLLLLPRTVLIQTFSASGRFEMEARNYSVLYIFQMVTLVISATVLRNVIGVAIAYSIVSVLIGWSYTAWQWKSLVHFGKIKLTIISAGEIRAVLTSFPLYSAPGLTRFGYQYLPILLISVSPLGSGAIAGYHAMRTLAGLLRQIVLQLSQMVGQEVASLRVAGKAIDARHLFQWASLLLAQLATVAGGALVVGSEPFFEIWTLGKLTPDWGVIAIMVLGTAACSSLFIRSQAQLARGAPLRPALAAYSSIGLTLPLAYILREHMTLFVIAGIFTGAEFLSFLFFLGLKPLDSGDPKFTAFSCAMIAVIGGGGVVAALFALSRFTHALDSWASLTITAFVALLMMLAVVFVQNSRAPISRWTE